VELLSGRVSTAARLCREGVLYLPANRAGWAELLHATASQAYAMAGDPARAAESWRAAQDSREPNIHVFDVMLMVTPAWVAAAEGAVSEAVELAETAARAAAESQQWAIEVNARHTAVCFGDPTQATRLTELATQVHGPRSDAAAAHATALATDDPAGLLAAADALQAAGLLLFAADATAQAASLHRRHGNAAESMTAAARAADLATRCEGARTPALAAALTPLPLTAREREIATMIHNGLPNRLIADRLRISVRTVEGHIYRACTKLGVPDRVTLGELVGKLS
jgi:DNA-binding NarL/FixJ family response regulator